MNKRNCSTENKRYVSKAEFAGYAGIGTTSAEKLALLIGAKRRIGRRCVYDLQALDEYLQTHDEVELTEAE